MLLLISLLLAVALHPVDHRARAARAGAGLVVSLLTLVHGAGSPVLLVTVVFTVAGRAAIEVDPGLSGAARTGRGSACRRSTRSLKRVVGEIFALPSSPEVAAQLSRPLALGTAALSGVVSMFFTLIVTIYLLLDGKRLYAWLIAYIPRVHRERMAIDRRRGVAGDLRLRARPGDHLGAVRGLRGGGAAPAARAGGACRSRSWPGCAT